MLCSPSHRHLKEKTAPSRSPPPTGPSVPTFTQESRRSVKWKTPVCLGGGVLFRPRTNRIELSFVNVCVRESVTTSPSAPSRVFAFMLFRTVIKPHFIESVSNQ